jgi:capsular exopolysaccharide synthesis family protein
MLETSLNIGHDGAELSPYAGNSAARGRAGGDYGDIQGKRKLTMDYAVDGGNQETRLSDLLMTVISLFRRRYLTMLLVTAGVFAAAIVLILMMSPKYDAVAMVRLDPSRNPLANAQSQSQGLSDEAIETEVGVLSSIELAQEVSRRLKLDRDPEFTEDFNKPGGPQTKGERANAIALELMRNLSVSREKLTYMLSVRYRASDPVKAATIANTFAEAYLDTRVGVSMGTAGKQVDFFKARLQELSNELNTADARIAQYRAQAGIVEGGSAGTITDQQVAPLSTQLATAESDAAAARSNLGAARAQISRGGLDAVSEVRTSPVITQLRTARADIVRNLTDIQSRDGENHPEMIKAREQLTQIDKQIQDEAARAIGSLQATADAADARAGTLRSRLGALEARQAQNNRAAVNVTSLERDAANKRAAYDRLAALSADSTQAAQNSIAQAVIADRAQPPIAPTSPNKPLLASLGLVIALALGIGTIVTQEMLSGGLNTVADVEGQFGIPVVASIPAMRKVSKPADDLIREPTTMFAEALRNARASILGVRTNSSSRVVAITSALPSEGKSTTALSFARILAMHGSKALLIDCDVRKATLQSLVEKKSPKDLVEVLQGKAQPSEAIIQDEQPGLALMMVNEPDFSGQDLFSGNAMVGLLEKLRDRYDVIVMDLPPVMGVADARFLSAIADVVTFVIKWNSTPISAVDASLNRLKSDRANVVGAIYTMVDPRSHAIGGIYYAQKYGSYYRR